MDYEKNKEALAIVKQMIADGQIAENVAAKYFPELAESEEERIRKHLITFFKDDYGENSNALFAGIKAKDIIAWLEKQGEQKPDWSDDDEQYLLVCKNALYKYQSTDHWDAGIIYNWLVNKLKSLRPQNQWKPSEQQMKALCDSIPDDGYLSDREILLDSLYKDLKAL